MTDLRRILVIVSSTRTERFADHLLAWVTSRLTERGDLEVEVLDVRDVDLPLYDRPRPPAVARREYMNDAERSIGARLDAADGYLVITNEYNHGYSAGLKNLLDHFFAELEHKPVAFLGYGNVGGSRAIEQLRQVVAELSMVSVRETVHILGYQFPSVRAGGDAAREVFASLEPRLTVMVDHLLWWADALRAAREA
ncbi:NADPH-dependent FMN reductase [Amnibacterium sp.]|uniref:NADPH-dependent FMN reductase n=1 Tax=Amnibacterium sp. TaxID=1872496 RepID=UPI0026358DC6|nr:NAD(P)H-dependent oxidoreductase [Amnibacterium sp.]MCU1474601.1 NAD(P)H-dependent oxidoreductase [Amnibacterium sp.]